MKAQAQRFGAEITMDYIENIDLSRRPFKLASHGKEYFANPLSWQWAHRTAN